MIINNAGKLKTDRVQVIETNMQNVEYNMKCTFLYFVGSFHFSLTPQEGNQRGNHDLVRALFSGCPLTSIQHCNCWALALAPLQPMDPCLSMVILNIIIAGPLPWYHYGPCDSCLGIT